MLRVQRLLDIAREAQQKDCDAVFIVIGNERMGKSRFTLCCMDYLGARDECICVDKEKLDETINALKKGDPFQFDEAADGLNTKEGLSKFNRAIEKLFMICGQENWITFILIPDFFLLSPMFRKRRIAGLFQVYKRGRVKYFGKSAIRKINFIHERYKSPDVRGKPLFYDTFPNYQGRLLPTYLDKKQAKVEQQKQSFKQNTEEKPTKQYEVTKKEKIIELLKQGWSIGDIAKEIQTDQGYISRIKRVYG